MTAPHFRGIYRTDLRARAAYAEAAGIYRMLPAAVARPADAADLTDMIGWAAAARVPLIPRGAGSAMGGGNLGTGLIVDLGGFDHPLEVDADRRLARTGAAVTLGELQSAAAPYRLRLPPDPSSGRWATLGGMANTNAAGARSVRYGSVRRWVQALQLITADGEPLRLERGEPAPAVRAVTRFEREAAPAIRSAAELIAERFPRVRKNSSGYALDRWLESGDLIDLLIGSEGTLAFVTEVTWRLDPVPAATSSLRLVLPDLDAVAPVVAALLPLDPSALELLDRTFLDVAAEGRLPASTAAAIRDAGAVILAEFERDSRAEAEAAADAAVGAVGGWVTAAAPARTAEEQAAVWQLRHAASPILAGLPEDRRSLQVIEDASVPVEKIGDYIRAVRAAADRQGIQVVIFGHAGDGNIHVNLLPELARPDWKAAVATILDEVTSAVIGLGGSLTGEHGDGRLRAPFLSRVYGAGVVDLFRRVKTAFDPLGILNPGVILPDGSRPIHDLKAGADALELPPDIARGLRQIEKTGGYAASRLGLAGAEREDGERTERGR